MRDAVIARDASVKIDLNFHCYKCTDMKSWVCGSVKSISNGFITKRVDFEVWINVSFFLCLANRA